MKNFAKIIVILLIVFSMFSTATVLFAQDFGIIVNQKAEIISFNDIENTIGYTASAIPWFAAPLGDNVDLYLSAGATAEYSNGEWGFLPEVYRFEATFNPSANFRLQTGRLYFGENLGWIMSGLFDGVSATVNINGDRLNAGVFYTGLLYKKAVDICISPQDKADYLDNEIYFASRRLAAGITWEKTSIFDSSADISLSGLFQFDLNDAEVQINTQYLVAKFTSPFGSNFNTEFGAVFELVEETDKDPRVAFAASAQIQWLQRSGQDGQPLGLFALGGRFTSGANDALGAFLPVTGEAQGKVLRPVLSGIALMQAAYTIRPSRYFFAELSAGYLFRTDTVSFVAEDMDPESNSPLLGGECFLSLSWQPFSDILLSLGGGAFFPQLGNVFADNAEIKYRLDITASISF